jgi:hypothetical protein
MIKSKNRPKGLRYSKEKFIPQLISAYGLCGKALQEEESVKQIIKPKKNIDNNFLIRQYFKREIKRFDKVLYELNIYDEDVSRVHAIRSTIIKFPYHYCEKCNDFKEYRIRSGYTMICKSCDLKKVNTWVKTKRKEDDLYRFITSTRGLIYMSLKNQGYTKNSKTFEILGCDFDTFKTHIERKFTKGMSWSNYGKWHLDHIYPISKATSFEMALKLNHYTNFQPLWAKDNISKKNKLVEHQMILPI